MVKLLTHNFLCSNVKGVKNPYPLRVRADQVEYGDAEFEPEVRGTAPPDWLRNLAAASSRAARACTRCVWMCRSP